jgi:hypothetical protein
MAGMIGLGILVAHLLADYVLQNDWMAREKTKGWFAAAIHGYVHLVVYSALFVVLGLDASFLNVMVALILIGGTHAIIDRYRLAKHLIWAVNQLAPRASRYPWAEARDNGGYAASKPAWMSTWLMIIVDNTMHLTINGLVVGVLIL